MVETNVGRDQKCTSSLSPRCLNSIYQSKYMDKSAKPSNSLSTPSVPSSSGTSRTWSMRYIVAASSMGTIIEWYDFYIFGSLAVFLAPVFFPSKTLGTSLILYLGTFAAGFAVRPFGALVFGRLGDKIGRKYAFLLTITIMGSATTVIGLLPAYQAIGILAPAILLFIRMLQGLALGGEYGGAAIYVAEHSPDKKRGYWTSYIQTTATVGLFLSLIIILATSLSLGTVAFADWGWRIPFLLSSVLVAAALYIRWRLRETPLFTRLKEMGRTATSPIKESIGRNWRLILLALFGATAGQAVVWYTGQFYALYFLQTDRKSTRLNSSHRTISYAVFCLKKKNIKRILPIPIDLHSTWVFIFLAITYITASVYNQQHPLFIDTHPLALVVLHLFLCFA